MEHIKTFLESFSDSEYFQVYDIIREMDDELDIEYMEFGNMDYNMTPGLRYRILNDKKHTSDKCRIVLSIKNIVEAEWYKAFDDPFQMKSELKSMKNWLEDNTLKRLKNEGFYIWYHDSYNYRSYSINILIFSQKQEFIKDYLEI